MGSFRFAGDVVGFTTSNELEDGAEFAEGVTAFHSGDAVLLVLDQSTKQTDYSSSS